MNNLWSNGSIFMFKNRKASSEEPADDVYCYFDKKRKLDGLSIRVNEPGMNISPTIYVNHMCEDYVTTENLNATLERAAEGFVNAILSRNVKLVTNLIANTRRIPYTPSGGHYVSGLSKTCGQLSSVTGRNDFYQYTSYRVCRVPDAKS